MEYLLFLQNVRENMNPAFNYFMNATSDFVIDNGMLFLLFVVSYIFDKRLGRKMCLACGFNIFMSIWAKNIACISRPWIRDSRIIPAKGMIDTAGGFSFPSGHATIAGSLFIPLVVYVKNNIIKVIRVIVGYIVVFLISNYVSPMGKQIFGSGSMIKYATLMFNITFLIPLIFTTYEKLLKLK